MRVYLHVIQTAYAWTVDNNGTLLGLTSGDTGYESTGIQLDFMDLAIWKLGVQQWNEKSIEECEEIVRNQSAEPYRPQWKHPDNGDLPAMDIPVLFYLKNKKSDIPCYGHMYAYIHGTLFFNRYDNDEYYDPDEVLMWTYAPTRPKIQDLCVLKAE